jgi:hypothetical protein
LAHAADVEPLQSSFVNAGMPRLMSGMAAGTQLEAADALFAVSDASAALAVLARGTNALKAILTTRLATAVILSNIVNLRRFIVVPRIPHLAR